VISVKQYDNEFEIERHLAVRDYLQSRNEDAIEYGKLKEGLPRQFPKDIEGYGMVNLILYRTWNEER
jgi:GrpB-like predicted nucleotidyltransferase (UPF0157 family)